MRLPCLFTARCAALGLILLFAPSVTIAQRPDSTERLLAVGDFLATHGKAANVSEQLTFLYETIAVEPGSCTATFRRMNRTESDRARSTKLSESLITFRFSDMSAAPQVRPRSDGSALAALMLVTLGADTSVRVHDRVEDGKQLPAVNLRRAEFTMPSKPVADSAAKVFAEATIACGGREPNAEQKLALQRADSIEAADYERRTYGSVAPSDRPVVLESCHARVRARLKSPATARFKDAPAWVATKGPDEVSIMGKVEAQNGFGGFREINYICTMERFGSQFVPKSVLVL